MKKRPTKSKTSTPSSAPPSSPAPSPMANIVAIQAAKQHLFDVAAYATVRCMKLFMGSVSTRAAMAASLAHSCSQIVQSSNSALEGRWIPVEDALNSTLLQYSEGLVSTRNTIEGLKATKEQIGTLDRIYKQIKTENDIAAFKTLRQASRNLNADNENKDHWQHVLRFWQTLNPEAVRIARWIPSEKEDEFSFKFNETTKQWLGSVGFTADILSTYATAIADYALAK